MHDQPEFIDLIRDTAEHMGLPESHIEKDYWVTYSLKRLSQSPHSKDVVFKGGTSLSKGYRLIDRFSEDIDLAILPTGLSQSQIKRKIKRVHEAASQDLTCIDGHDQESKGSKFRRTMHRYPQFGVQTADDQVAPELMIEVNSFTTPSPYSEMSIQSIIADVLIERGFDELVLQFNLEEFNLNILAAERTLVEKVLAIIKHSYDKNDPVVMLQGKIRHLYDIHQIMQRDETRRYLSGPEFPELCRNCIEEERETFGDEDRIYRGLLSKAPIFVKFGEWMPELNRVYSTTFKAMTYKELPPLADIAKTLNTIQLALRHLGEI